MIIHIKGIYSHFPKVLINRSCQLQEMSLMELHYFVLSTVTYNGLIHGLNRGQVYSICKWLKSERNS